MCRAKQDVHRMNDSNVVELRSPAGDALGELLKKGARKLLAQAVEAELAEFLANDRLLAGDRSLTFFEW